MEWNPSKAASNVKKHGVRFADAVEVLEDDRAVTMPETIDDEERFITIGMDAMDRILVVIHTHRVDSIRIISARKATSRERSAYEE